MSPYRALRKLAGRTVPAILWLRRQFSPAMVTQAQASYPGLRFEVGDATAPALADGAFDIVYNGVSPMHISDYADAIAKSGCVAVRGAFFRSVKVVFNRDGLLRDFGRAGLKFLQSWRSINYDVGHLSGESSYAESLLCHPTETIP